jgi:hypothetical protein
LIILLEIGPVGARRWKFGPSRRIYVGLDRQRRAGEEAPNPRKGRKQL